MLQLIKTVGQNNNRKLSDDIADIRILEYIYYQINKIYYILYI